MPYGHVGCCFGAELGPATSDDGIVYEYCFTFSLLWTLQEGILVRNSNYKDGEYISTELEEIPAELEVLTEGVESLAWLPIYMDGPADEVEDMMACVRKANIFFVDEQ
ncbi:MAG: hypothetical protein WCO52_04450 [bacterium]